MQLEFDVSQVVKSAEHFRHAADRLMDGIERRATEHSSDAVRFIQRRYRTGAPYTTSTRTAVRASRLIDAYDSRVSPVIDGARRGFDVGVGLIAPNAGDDVLRYGRVHEGYDAAGTKVDKFVIVPRAAEWLTFKLPPEQGGGWVRTKRVELTPRPSLPAVQEKLKPVLEHDIADAYRQVVQ